MKFNSIWHGLFYKKPGEKTAFGNGLFWKKIPGKKRPLASAVLAGKEPGKKDKVMK